MNIDLVSLTPYQLAVRKEDCVNIYPDQLQPRKYVSTSRRLN